MLYGADPFVPVLPSKPGFGHTVPAGIEAILEFNGLLLNVNKDAERYKINSIDGLFDADVRDIREPKNDDDGEQPLNSFYGGRTLVLAGSIESHSVKRMRQMQQDLRAAFANIRREKPLRFRMYDSALDHFIMVKKLAPISGIEQQTNLKAWRDFQISLRASNPRFLSESQHEIVVDELEADRWVPRFLFGPQNLGNYIADTVIRVYGPCSYSKIINEEEQTFFIMTNIPEGNFFEYDSAAQTLVDGAGTNKWSNLGDDSNYVHLVRGTNNFYYLGDAPKVSVSWRHSWI